MRRRLTFRPAVLVALAASGIGAPAAAADTQFESGLVFRDQGPVSLSSSQKKATTPVVLCNASSRRATALRWSLGGFQFSEAGGPIPDEKVISLTDTRPQLGAGACATATITVAANRLDAGPFSGQLVVTSAGAGVARIEVDVAGSPSPVVPTQGASETVELTATRKLPFSASVSVDNGSELALKAPPEGKSLDLAGKNAFIGNLVNAGDVASVFVTGTPDKTSSKGVWLLPIEVRGAGHTGEYQGTLMPTASADEKQVVKMKLKVTDWWVWAVLAVLLGALIAVLPTLYIRRWRLESKLHSRHRALPETYSSAGQDFHKHFPRFAKIEPPSAEEIGSYTAAVDGAIRAYAESTWYFDTTSDAYAKIVQSLDAAKADAECLGGETGLGKALTDLDDALKRLAEHLASYLPIDRQPALALAAGAVLRPGRLAVGEATIRTRKAKEALATIEAWTELAQTLRRCEVWFRILDELVAPSKERNFSEKDLGDLKKIYAELGEARNELLEAGDAEDLQRLEIHKRLTRVYGQLALLGSRFNVWVTSEPPPDGSAGDWPKLKVEMEGESKEIPPEVRQTIVAIQKELPSSVKDSGSWRDNADVLLVSPAKPVELGRTKRFIGDAMVLILAATTGTVTALSAFYFGKTFGTIEDYLTVIFIGTAAQAFLKPISDTLAQLHGGTEPVTKSDPQKAEATRVSATSPLLGS